MLIPGARLSNEARRQPSVPREWKGSRVVMSPTSLLVIGLVAFLAVIGFWAFSLSETLDNGIGQAPIALTLAGLVAAALAAGFIWLGRRGRR